MTLNLVKSIICLLPFMALTAEAGSLNLKVCNLKTNQYSQIDFDDEMDSLTIKSFANDSTLLSESIYPKIYAQMPVSKSNFHNLEALLNLAEIQDFSDGLLINPTRGSTAQVLLLRYTESDYSVISASEGTGTIFLGKTSNCSEK